MGGDAAVVTGTLLVRDGLPLLDLTGGGGRRPLNRRSLAASSRTRLVGAGNEPGRTRGQGWSRRSTCQHYWNGQHMARLTGRISLAVLVLSLVGGCDWFRPVASVVVAGSVNSVKLMTFNIFHDASDPRRGILAWGARSNLVITAVRWEMPDVLGLQEAYMSQVQQIVDAIPQYAFVGRGRNADGGGESVSILFRSDRFDLAASGHFWFADSPDVPGMMGGESWGYMGLPRMVTWVRLTRKETGKSFYVYNTHLASKRTAHDAELSRTRSVELLVSRIASRPNPTEYFFVIGDFNATENAWPISYLKGARCAPTAIACPSPPPAPEFRMLDAFRLANPSSDMGTRCNTGGGTGNRIDYIFVWNPVPINGLCDVRSGPCEPPHISEVRIEGNMGRLCASDHRPVVGKFMIPPAGD
jgi:endonuclease/exonuclease/phosphatase family metal-dependent hydrolase